MADLPIFDDSQVQTVLCVVAHPDDMEYGGSAAVARWVEHGAHVSYLLLTAGEAGIRGKDPSEVGPLRSREQREACAAVGVENLTILDLPDGMLEHGLDLRRRLTPDLGHAESSTMLGEARIQGWPGRT
ncbi:PIG-L deacetylase family protein, partial [Kocuria gwangalliensis]|uniref:PIG-L deacetylase family protein n=1 Tax=Kocuria gwangalliensis TaxID=501592 RepID=UPI0031E72C14